MKGVNTKWSNYGRWRQAPFPTISIHSLANRLIEKYDLPDLKVVSVEQVAYGQEPALVGVEYPGKSTV